jgi:hypothetical protein
MEVVAGELGGRLVGMGKRMRFGWEEGEEGWFGFGALSHASGSGRMRMDSFGEDEDGLVRGG